MSKHVPNNFWENLEKLEKSRFLQIFAHYNIIIRHFSVFPKNRHFEIFWQAFLKDY